MTPLLQPTINGSSSSKTTSQDMRDDDGLPVSTSTTTSSKREGCLFGRGRCKFWALAAILLLAFWSMLTGTVNLNRFDDDSDSSLHHDLDVLEIEEREKLVKQMWDVYTNSKRLKLPKFWQQAFEAAYEGLAGDDSSLREEAFSQIAKMSLRYISHSYSAASIIHELNPKVT